MRTFIKDVINRNVILNPKEIIKVRRGAEWGKWKMHKHKLLYERKKYNHQTMTLNKIFKKIKLLHRVISFCAILHQFTGDKISFLSDLVSKRSKTIFISMGSCVKPV